jgi:hypothetical protein
MIAALTSAATLKEILAEDSLAFRKFMQIDPMYL